MNDPNGPQHPLFLPGQINCAEGVDGQSQLYSFRLAPLPPAEVVAMGGDGRVDVVWGA